MNIFTNEEIDYINSRNLTAADIYDGRGESKKDCHDHAKENGCRFYIGTRCHNGHILRSRSGHCVVCSPAAEAFLNRHIHGGGVYVASNGVYTKVGSVDNNIKELNKAIHNREIRLNTYDGYGGSKNWKIVAWKPTDKTVGVFEHAAQKLLSQYSVKADYIYSDGLRTAQELFTCNIKEAMDAVDKVLDTNWTFA